MKIIAFILSIYILALNFTPCEDANYDSDTTNMELSITSDADHNHNDLDLCSPFCQCQCCQIFATSFTSSDFSILTIISTEMFLHFDNLGEEIPNTILQPPRV